jgi:N-acetylmuramoyl-L-alanine amidase
VRVTRAGNIDRVKRRLLAAAVTENLDTMRGLPPRSLRPAHRVGRAWLRRVPLFLIPLTLAGSTWVTWSGGSQPAGPPRLSQMSAALNPAALKAFAPPASVDVEKLVPVSAAAFPLSVRRVVLDAGHGGSDPGASSTASLAEKDITLDVERRLRSLLEKSGFEVVVTRTDDRLIALRDRARVANRSDGDIFVSIHVNSIQKHVDSHGVETYYLGATSDPELTRLAAAENLESGYTLADMRKLLDRLYADARRDESRRLAAAVQQQLFGGLRATEPGLENWGVKRAPFLVLVATEMPAILAEVGCLSNDREARMLQRPEYRQQIAEALFSGIRAYAAQKKG